MANKYDLIPNPDQDSRIEVYLKNDEIAVPEEAELSLLNVFNNMKKSFRLYAWVMLLTFTLGLVIPYLSILFKKNYETVSAVITYEYAGASQLKAPDGSNLDVGFLKNSRIISDALRDSHLSKTISVNSISENISISRMLSSDTRQQLEIMEKVNEANSTTNDPQKYIDAVNGVNYSYKNQYIITLKNGFGNEDDAVSLSGEELSILLNNIIDSYQEYFFENYDNFKLPDNTIEDINLDELDYIEWMDNMDDILEHLSSYCTSTVKSEYYNYRSAIDGLSFADINKMINLIKSVRVDYLYSYLYYNSISKDKDSLVTKFKYQKRTLNHTLNTVIENIKSGEELIAGYKNSNILINRPSTDGSEAADITSKSITDYYNNLILKQENLYNQKTSLELRIDNLDDKIQGYTNAENSAASISIVENEINEVNKIVRQLYSLTRRHAEDIINGEAYKNSFMSKINSTFYGGFFEAGNIKIILIGGAAGLFLGFALWFGYSFIKEWKDADAKVKA